MKVVLSNPDDNIDEQAVAWFIRLRADNVSQEEKEAFMQWLSLTDEHLRAFNEICDMWGDADLLKSLTNNAQQYGIAPTFKGKKKSAKRNIMPLALMICVICFLVLFEPLTIFIKADYSSTLGERKTIQLDDGSTAILNTDSAIASNMQNGERSVELLKGEAFFHVKPNIERPFLVKAKYSTTRVLGTRFFVHHQNNGDEIKVLSGRVEVSEKQNTRPPVILRDLEAITISDTILSQPQKLNSALSTSWINGFLAYNNETLENVVNNINRYHTGMIFFKDNSLRQLKINGRLSIREPRAMLTVLQQTMNIRITYLTDWLIIIG